ncbi:MAG TPA: transporter [Usitatibacter sp.]|nr:transporter [Usitatibacter sp.]
MQRSTQLLAAAACAAALDASASCGAAFCMVNTDWSAQGAWTGGGARFDVRFETIDLDQPMAGSERISVGQVPRHHDEVHTRNRNLVATVDWSLSPLWGASISMPYVDRKHFHIHNHHGDVLEDRWDFRGVGDVKLQARYVVSDSGNVETPCSSGMILGIKLPTGKYDVANGDGELAERTLQPGTGTTDAILGAYWHRAEPLEGWSYFTRGQAALPLTTRAGFKPGMQFQGDAGARYALNSQMGVMLQVNAIVKARDRGDNAEPEDSGQRAVYLSPGLSWNVGRDAQLYAFVQLPLYQRVNGVQLTADWSAAAGVSWRF